MMAARRATEFAGNAPGGFRGRRESIAGNNNATGLQVVVDEDEDDGEDDVMGFGVSTERR